MSQQKSEAQTAAETPVDDVRRVRERLDREAGGDVHELARQSREAARQLRERLGLKEVKPAKPMRMA